MTVFACTGCDATLTAPVSQVPLPAHARVFYGNGVELDVLMEAGTYALGPAWGSPWRLWAEVGADEATARGYYVPVHAVPWGDLEAAVIAPGDVRGTVLIPQRRGGACCGLNSGDGPNLACIQCGQPVATRIDDCSAWQAVWFDPQAVYAVDDDAASQQAIGWEALREAWPAPPVELWDVVVGAALAHLLAVSGGMPVTVPDGPVADTFRPAFDALLPPRPPAKTLALAGPGLPVTSADIALVPQHPQTGEVWTSAGAADVVPLAWGVWVQLAFHYHRRHVAGAGAMPADALRDDPPSPMPWRESTPCYAVFLSTLARLPEVRQPWLREIYDRVKDRPWDDPF